MAIDARINLAGIVPQSSQAINIFENALMNSQTRDIRGQQAEQQALLNPLQVQQQQQNVDINAQTLEGNRATQRLQNIHQTGQRLKPFLVNGDVQGATKFMLDNISNLQDRIEAGEDIDLTESLETLQNLQAGNGQQVLQDITAVEGLVGSGQQTRVTSSKILDDGTTVQSLSTGGTNVISPSGQVLQGNERTDALNNALQSKVQQKGDIAQAVSDVKVGEVITLETESAQIAQDIAAKKVTIDETKFKNTERRDQVINAKNARRKEADAAIIQIDGLLKDDRFSQAFGKQTAVTPELLRSESVIDAVADVNQIKGLITLESRQKLKGQGTITDSEQKILAQSATVLDNPLISDERARKELRKIKRVFEDSSDRNQLKRETKDRIEAEAVEEVAPTSQFQEGQTATGQNGERIVFTNGQWVAL
tara:strand:- start:6657 stop:7925 length:1269 start_codon:yes stop_codon:yes gene_type:complete